MYLLMQPFTNGATGRTWSAGRTVTTIPWLSNEQIRACVDEGSLRLFEQSKPQPEPDDLTLLDGITVKRAALLNAAGIFTFADMLKGDLTILPHVGNIKAAEIKRAAGEMINVTT